jgi:hypothetical protein
MEYAVVNRGWLRRWHLLVTGEANNSGVRLFGVPVVPFVPCLVVLLVPLVPRESASVRPRLPGLRRPLECFHPSLHTALCMP